MKLRRLRDQRTRKIQTLFGTITLDAPRISACSCRNVWGFVDVALSPLAELLPDRCTPELPRLQTELSARHSYRETARLLETVLYCGPVNHATMRNRTHRVASELESMATVSPKPRPEIDPSAEMLVLINGAHIRAAHGFQSRHIDVTVGKIEVVGKPRKIGWDRVGGACQINPDYCARNITQAEAEHVIQPHGVANDLGWDQGPRIGSRGLSCR
jgi:hypothetical protein